MTSLPEFRASSCPGWLNPFDCGANCLLQWRQQTLRQWIIERDSQFVKSFN